MLSLMKLYFCCKKSLKTGKILKVTNVCTICAKGYDPHKLHVASIPKGKYANWDVEIMWRSWTCVFHVPMTTVLIRMISFSKCATRLKIDVF